MPMLSIIHSQHRPICNNLPIIMTRVLLDSDSSNNLHLRALRITFSWATLIHSLVGFNLKRMHRTTCSFQTHLCKKTLPCTRRIRTLLQRHLSSSSLPKGQHRINLELELLHLDCPLGDQLSNLPTLIYSVQTRPHSKSQTRTSSVATKVVMIKA